MTKFLSPNSTALMPTFLTNCPDGSHSVQMGSHFAQNTTPSPCSLLRRNTSLLGICMYTKDPNPTPKHPYSWPELKKKTKVWATWTPTGQNVWKVDKTFLEVGKKKLFIKKHANLHAILEQQRFFLIEFHQLGRSLWSSSTPDLQLSAAFEIPLSYIWAITVWAVH